MQPQQFGGDRRSVRVGGGEGEGSSEGFPDSLHIFTNLEKNVIKFLAKGFLRSKSRRAKTIIGDSLKHSSIHV